MTKIERPDLTQVSTEILRYIEQLESELTLYRKEPPLRTRPEIEEQALPPEPPSTMNLVTISRQGMIKRTPRHLYPRQHRAGMGIFDLDIPEADAPSMIFTADESQDLLLITDWGRAYRFPLNSLVESPVRARGQSLNEAISIPSDEKPKVILPACDEGYLAILSSKGYVRVLRHNYISDNMQLRTSVFDVGKYGPVAAGTWTSGGGDLFIVTRKGLGIRFREKLVQNTCGLGIRLEPGDEVVAISEVIEDSGVFLVGSNGRGTIRLMSGFRANKAPGAGGKIAMKTDYLVGAMTVNLDQDIFIISQLSKIIRFPAVEIPPKSGVVEGVSCMSLRADKVSAAA